MSRKLTRITLPGSRAGYVDWGERTYEEMRAELRSWAEYQMKLAREVLEAGDTDFKVEVVRGSVVQRLIREVAPIAARTGDDNMGW